MALKDKLMTLEDFKAVRDVDVASNSAQFTEIKADLVDAYSSGSTPFVDMLDDTDTTNSGISYSLSGNTLSCDGTSTDTSQFAWFGTTSSRPPYWFVGGGKYIVSIDSTTELVDVRFQIKRTSNTSLHSLAIYSQSGKYILDVPEDITVLRVVSIVNSGITLNNDTLTLDIERVIDVDSDMSELRSGLGVLGIKNELTWNDGSYKTDGTISTNVQYGNRYSNIIDATTFNKLTITPFLGRQVCVAFFDRITGAFVSRSDYTTESVTIDNTYSVGINLATTYTDRTISTEDLLSLVEIYRSIPLSKWTGRKVAFVGDSITHGSYAPIPYHAVLNNMIGFSDMYVDGVAGSAYSVTATGNYTPISQRWQNIPTDRDLVVIFAGTNDWGYDAPIGTPADTTDVSMCGALSVVINGILTANPSARLVLITPLHRWGYTSGNYPNDTDNNGQGHPLADYVDAIKDMAQAYSIPVIDLFSDSGLNPRIPAISTAFFQDGLHPINAGHARLARQIASELEVLNFSGSGIKANLEAKYSQLQADLGDKIDLPSNGYGVSGKVLRSTGSGTEWAEVGQPTDEQTNEAVSSWLTQHPEATTTVLDGSLTLSKFKDGELPFVTPEQFGAVGDGIADDTVAMSLAFNSGFPVALIKGKNYYITSIEVSHPLLVYGNGATISTTCGESNIRVIICYSSAKTVIFYDTNFETTVGVSTTGAHGETITNRSKRTAISGYALELMRVVGCTFNGFDEAIIGQLTSGDTTFANVLDTLIVEDTLIKNALIGISRMFRHVFIDNCIIELDKNSKSGEHCIYLLSDVLEDANITSTVCDASESSSGATIQFWPANGSQATNIVIGTYVISNCILIGDCFVNLMGGGVCNVIGCDMRIVNYSTTNRRRQFNCPQESSSVINVVSSNVNIELLDPRINVNFNSCKLYSNAMLADRVPIAKANNCEIINIGVMLYGAAKFRECVFSSPVKVPGNYYVAVHNTASGGYMANCIFESDGTATTISYNTSGSCSLVNPISSLPIGSGTDSITVVNKINAL